MHSARAIRNNKRGLLYRGYSVLGAFVLSFALFLKRQQEENKENVWVNTWIKRLQENFFLFFCRRFEAHLPTRGRASYLQRKSSLTGSPRLGFGFSGAFGRGALSREHWPLVRMAPTRKWVWVSGAGHWSVDDSVQVPLRRIGWVVQAVPCARNLVIFPKPGPAENTEGHTEGHTVGRRQNGKKRGALLDGLGFLQRNERGSAGP